MLYGPRFRRLLPDVHLTADTPIDLALLSHAAHLLVTPGGVLAGYSAAELLAASCAPLDASAEVIMHPATIGGPARGCEYTATSCTRTTSC